METSSIEKNIDVIQGVINRIANNSSNCKTWCVTIVSAIIVLAFDKTNNSLLYLTYYPIILFYFLDSYYLSLERDFINLYNEFVVKYQKGNLSSNDLFFLNIKRGFFSRIITTLKAAINSPSTLPFYGIMLIIIHFSKIYFRGV